MLFHLAAIYDLAVRATWPCASTSKARATSTASRSVPSLRRYHYVSTCYVAGLRIGRILETELRHEAGFRNYYEETKYLAELEVDALKARLPVTIHRPAVVCGDSRTGETAKYDGIYYLIHYLRKRPSLFSLAQHRQSPSHAQSCAGRFRRRSDGRARLKTSGPRARPCSSPTPTLSPRMSCSNQSPKPSPAAARASPSPPVSCA